MGPSSKIGARLAEAMRHPSICFGPPFVWDLTRFRISPMKKLTLFLALAVALLGGCATASSVDSSSFSSSESESISSSESESSSSDESSSISSSISSSSSSSSSSSRTPTTSYDADNYYRLSPEDFSEKIYTFDGESCTFSDSGYTITIDQDCLDAESVCYYWMAFEQMPPNYFTTDEYKSDTTAAVRYGKNGRCASRYSYGSYSGGYAQVIGPFYNQTSTGYYWEFDIALSSVYNTGSSITRGTGRVVVVVDGLKVYGGDGPVCFYTTDHYSSFREFVNYQDGWGGSFKTNATKPIPTTIHLQ